VKSLAAVMLGWALCWFMPSAVAYADEPPAATSSVPDAAPSSPPVSDAPAQAQAAESTSPSKKRGPVTVSVRGGSRAKSVRNSAAAVTVVELEQAKQQSADLGEVLARNTAVSVQVAGGLGSRASFSLGGLGGERLRFFLDGVPLELMGYPSIQYVPVNLIDRIDVYLGVVPVRLGADALGGAVELITDRNVRNSRFSASYQFGSFGTHRVTASGRAFHEPTGLFVKGAFFYDTADNDYDVDVWDTDERGHRTDARLPFFHNGYRGTGGQLGVGVVDKAWADALVVSGFISDFDNDIQTNAIMSQPYGAVTLKRDMYGVNAKYSLTRGDTNASVVAGYAALNTHFRDVSNCVFDWRGRCSTRAARGEISGTPQSIDQSTGTFFFRGNLIQRIYDDHALRLTLASTYADRSGDNRLRTAGYDPLSQPRRLFTGFAGLELESSFWESKLKNIAFVKGYAFVARSKQLLATGAWQNMSRDMFRMGGGDNLSLELTRDLSAKVSYEYTLRQPSTDELFGDGSLTLDNLSLRPETSHNANLGLYVDQYTTVVGSFHGSIEGFARWPNDEIVLLTKSEYLRSVNVQTSRTLGVDTAVGWTAPHGDWLSVDGRLTYQDRRNTSSTGEYAPYVDQRIPNQPYLFGSAVARLRARSLVVAADTVDLSWNLRYVHGFYLMWENLAKNATQRPIIDSQLSHGVVLTYSYASDAFAMHVTFEVQNIANAKLYDFYGVQRPGRAAFVKCSVDL